MALDPAVIGHREQGAAEFADQPLDPLVGHGGQKIRNRRVEAGFDFRRNASDPRHLQPQKRQRLVWRCFFKQAIAMACTVRRRKAPISAMAANIGASRWPARSGAANLSTICS